MKIGIIQSNYLPWRGYFEFISSVDRFVLLDDVQFTIRDWRTRNMIKTEKGIQWISVPVRKGSRARLINETIIDYSRRWQDEHLNIIQHNYRKSPYIARYAKYLAEKLNKPARSLSELNEELVKWVLELLDIKTPLIRSADINVTGTKTERLINIVKALDGKIYVSGPAAKAYLDIEQFKNNGIGLEYKTYDYPEYPQINGPFVGNVSIIDLLCNCGPESRKYIHSLTPNEVVIP